jgi:hypothetical protein
VYACQINTREREVGNNIKNEVWFTIYVELLISTYGRFWKNKIYIAKHTRSS